MSKGKILIVEDDKNARLALVHALQSDGFEVQGEESGEGALSRLREEEWDLILCDVVLPGIDGLEVLRRVNHDHPGVAVIMMTAYGTIEKAVEAMREGAYDFIEKPLQLTQLRKRIKEALEEKFRAEETILFRKNLEKERGFNRIMGKSPKIEEVLRIVKKVAPSNATVLITGESGTGKELVADAIHFNSNRVSKALVKVNCVSFAEGIIESELFGHEKGAFTGAVKEKKGRFEIANGGTLFLDEAGEIPPRTQVKLLRVLQEREIERVGGTRPIPVDVRLISASNKDLEKAVNDGSFREDLYYRLKVISIRLPPLRERKEDIPLLVNHFILKFNAKNSKNVKGIDRAGLNLLQNYSWPGNIRQLENCVETAVVMAEEEFITSELLPLEVRAEGVKGGTVSLSLGTSLKEVEREMIIQTLNHVKGNKTKAAQILGIGIRTLYRKLEEYGWEEEAPAE